MRIRILVLTLAIAAIAAVPSATAVWYAKGMFEPDTNQDISDGWMRTSPDQSNDNVRRVYFNAFSTQSIGAVAEVSTSVNPNVGTLETSYITSSGRAYAMLGVWKDCNKDGFVGYGDQGLFEYRYDLLTLPGGAGASVCPIQPLPATIPRGWTPTHNDGTWVREWIPIGYEVARLKTGSGADAADNNPYNMMDMDARVWWDWGLPTDRTLTRCYAFAPQGTYHSTGGFIEWADCFDGFKVTDTVNSAPIDGTPAGQLTFRDQPRDQSESDSALNIANPYGDVGGSPMVDAWDCNSEDDQLAHVDLSPTSNYDVGVPRPRTSPAVDPTGSPGGTMNETLTGLDDCDRSDNWQQDDWERAAGQPYGLEQDVINTKSVKIQTGYVMRFNEGFRSPASVGSNPQQLGRAAPKDLGTRATEAEGFWVSASRIGESYNPMVDRESQTAQRVTFVTTYAIVSTKAISDHSLNIQGTLATYGSDHCAGLSPITGEWECDPAKWWLNPDGTQADRTTDNVGGQQVTVAVRVGQAYNVRDIDCYDFSAAGARQENVHYGVLSGTSCPRPPSAFV